MCAPRSRCPESEIRIPSTPSRWIARLVPPWKILECWFNGREKIFFSRRTRGAVGRFDACTGVISAWPVKVADQFLEIWVDPRRYDTPIVQIAAICTEEGYTNHFIQLKIISMERFAQNSIIKFNSFRITVSIKDRSITYSSCFSLSFPPSNIYAYSSIFLISPSYFLVIAFSFYSYPLW